MRGARVLALMLVSATSLLAAGAPPEPVPRAARPASAARTAIDDAAALLQSGDNEAAERQLRRLIANGAGGASARGLLAVALARQEKEKEAEELLAEALAGGPEVGAKLRSAANRVQSVRTLLLLAHAQAGMHDGAGAVASLAAARQLAPNSEDVLSAQAQLALAMHNPQNALAPLDLLTRMHSAVAQYHYFYGISLLQLADSEDAAEELLQADRLEPDQTLTMVALGVAMNGRKQYEEARRYLERGLEREAQNVDVLAALAEAEEGSGQLGEAEAHARRALAISSGDPNANLVLGMLLLRQEHFPEARAALEKAVASDPSSSKAHYQLSLACARVGDEEAAQREQRLYAEARRAFEKRAQEQLEQRSHTRHPGGGGGMGQ